MIGRPNNVIRSLAEGGPTIKHPNNLPIKDAQIKRQALKQTHLVCQNSSI